MGVSEFIVRKLSTGKVHIVQSKESYKTLCGQICQSNVINDCNNGFGSIKNKNELLNVPEITCKTCLRKVKPNETPKSSR